MDSRLHGRWRGTSATGDLYLRYGSGSQCSSATSEAAATATARTAPARNAPRLEREQDLADVRALVQLYIDGSNGDGDKICQAFHPDAHMFGHIGPMDTYEPISAASISSATRAWRSSLRRTTSAATSSTSSPWLGSRDAGGSRTRRTRTLAAPRPPAERFSQVRFTEQFFDRLGELLLNERESVRWVRLSFASQRA